MAGNTHLISALLHPYRMHFERGEGENIRLFFIRTALILCEASVQFACSHFGGETNISPCYFGKQMLVPASMKRTSKIFPLKFCHSHINKTCSFNIFHH